MILRASLLIAVTIFVVTSTPSTAQNPSEEMVSKYQAFLRQQGYDPGPINGIVSSKTITAIQQYIAEAKTGDLVSQYHVGTLYDQGIGVPRDSAEAVSWYRRAADRGLNEAQYMLGTRYEQGKGLPKDLVQAYAWYYVALQGFNKHAKRGINRIEARLTAHQHQQALELGKKLFAVCGTSKAQ